MSITDDHSYSVLAGQTAQKGASIKNDIYASVNTTTLEKLGMNSGCMLGIVYEKEI